MIRRSAVAGVLIALHASPTVSAEATMVCLNSGHTYQVGDFACLPGCHGKRRYARCEIVAEQASWTFISDVCPTADLTPPDPTDITLVPLVTAMSPIPFVVDWSPIDPAIAPRLRQARPTQRLAFSN